MQKDSRLFEDMARLAGNAAGTLNDIRHEFEAQVQSKVKQILRDMDVVTREEFDVVKAMAEKAREENEALKARVEALEAADAKPAKRKKS